MSRSESVSIDGPVGRIEALLDVPAQASASLHVAIVCHPHPLHGGTMTNKVVHTLARAFNELGMPAVRFNYRGVGASAGSYADGDGETQDALAVIDWARKRWSTAGIVMGGFSFGGAVAIRAAAEQSIAALITVAPAIRLVPVSATRLPQCPWLIVQGDRDELVDAADVQRWATQLPTPPQIKLLSGVEHFFHGRLNELRESVTAWLRSIAQ